MKKVITYGTYDFLHYGHIRLLERAKALGDYLIVGITADDFDKNRGKHCKTSACKQEDSFTHLTFHLAFCFVSNSHT